MLKLTFQTISMQILNNNKESRCRGYFANSWIERTLYFKFFTLPEMDPHSSTLLIIQARNFADRDLNCCIIYLALKGFLIYSDKNQSHIVSADIIEFVCFTGLYNFVSIHLTC